MLSTTKWIWSSVNWGHPGNVRTSCEVFSVTEYDEIGNVNYSGSADVIDFAVAAGPVEPGNSTTLEITSRGGFKFISVAGMLVSTNDAFFAVRDIRIRPRGKVIAEAKAYDAGSEANSEDCDYIPGPPCGSNAHDGENSSEGYVHVHAGIHGIADLNPAMHDWRNPVAKITIRPIYWWTPSAWRLSLKLLVWFRSKLGSQHPPSNRSTNPKATTVRHRIMDSLTENRK